MSSIVVGNFWHFSPLPAVRGGCYGASGSHLRTPGSQPYGALHRDRGAVVPEYPLRRKSLILPPEWSTLDSTIGQPRLAFAMESPKRCEELIDMGRHPSAWMTELVEGVAG